MIALGIVLFGSAHAQAESLADDELLDLSIEDLLDASVTSTTRGAGLRLQDAPGIVRVYTADDIERYHLRTLKDLLKTVPGAQVNEYRAGHSLVWIRGVQSRYNNKILLRIDGVPVRDSYYGHFSIDEGLPLDQVERVEVITGPGGVLYGANAFSGVISITTKQAGRSASGSYATDDTYSVDGEFSLSSERFGSAYAFGMYQQTEGWDPVLNSDGSAYPHPQHGTRGYGIARYQRGFAEEAGRVTVIGSYGSATTADRYRKKNRARFHERKPGYGSLAYEKSLGDRGRFNLSGYYEDYGLSKEESKFLDDGTLVSIEKETFDTTLYGAELIYSNELKGHALTFGVSYQGYQAKEMSVEELFPGSPAETALHDPSAQPSSTGIFGQDVWRIADWLSLTVGLRGDFLSDFKDEVTYRVGLNASHGSLYGKLLFGTAYRVPSFREYIDVTAYNESLESEHLMTFEAQIGFRFERGDVNLTFFYNDYEDFVREIEVDTIGSRTIDDEYAINADWRKMSGIELFGNFLPFDGLRVRFGATVMLVADEKIGSIDTEITLLTAIETGETEISFLPAVTANLEAAYDFTERFSAGTRLLYVSERSRPSGGVYQSGVDPSVRNDANRDGFFKVDLFGSYALTPSLKVRAWVDNLFDTVTYSQPYGNPANYDSEWPGLKLGFEVEKRF